MCFTAQKHRPNFGELRYGEVRSVPPPRSCQVAIPAAISGSEIPRILLPCSTVHTVASNRPRYRREEACPRETSACSQTYDAENTATPLKRRYGKRYIT